MNGRTVTRRQRRFLTVLLLAFMTLVAVSWAVHAGQLPWLRGWVP